MRRLVVGTSSFDMAVSSGAVKRQTYEDFRLERTAFCRNHYVDTREAGLITFITTVWNTDIEFLRTLTESMLAQSGGYDFQWLILDNGSNNPSTIAFLNTLTRYHFIRLERVEVNLGIIGGMRYCLERATSSYIAPLDSDDILVPQCVSIVTQALREAEYPPLLYSDEDKIDGGAYRDPYFKPDWDPVLFVNSCYIAHLCAIDRKMALSLGVYDDPGTEGSHDWDTFTRFMIAGHQPVHVPEVLYTWRMHHGSTAGNIHSKPVVYDSHQRVLGKFIADRGSQYFELTASALFGGMPDWSIARKHIDPRPVVTIIMIESSLASVNFKLTIDDYAGHSIKVIPIGSSLAGLRALVQESANIRGAVHLIWDQVSVIGADFLWEGLGLLELFPDAVMVGGRIKSDREDILAAGEYFGFGNGCGSPDRGRSVNDPGYFAQMWKPHSVSAVSSQNAIVDAAFLLETLDALNTADQPASLFHLGAWCGAHARRTNKRIIYSPFLFGSAPDQWSSRVEERERRAFAQSNWDLFPETTLYSRRLGLNAENAYRPVPEDVRTAHLDFLARRFGIHPAASGASAS